MALSASITRQFGGTGISYSPARLIQNEILIEGEKNQGTICSFTLTLPTGTVADLPPRRTANYQRPGAAKQARTTGGKQ